MVDSLLRPTARTKRRGTQALARTIGLGTLAVAAAIYWLADAYGIELEALMGYLVASLAFVAICAVAGVVAALLLRLLRRRS